MRESRAKSEQQAREQRTAARAQPRGGARQAGGRRQSQARASLLRRTLCLSFSPEAHSFRVVQEHVRVSRRPHPPARAPHPLCSQEHPHVAPHCRGGAAALCSRARGQDRLRTRRGTAIHGPGCEDVAPGGQGGHRPMSRSFLQKQSPPSPAPVRPLREAACGHRTHPGQRPHCDRIEWTGWNHWQG